MRSVVLAQKSLFSAGCKSVKYTDQHTWTAKKKSSLFERLLVGIVLYQCGQLAALIYKVHDNAAVCCRTVLTCCKAGKVVYNNLLAHKVMWELVVFHWQDGNISSCVFELHRHEWSLDMQCFVFTPHCTLQWKQKATHRDFMFIHYTPFR